MSLLRNFAIIILLVAWFGFLFVVSQYSWVSILCLVVAIAVVVPPMGIKAQITRAWHRRAKTPRIPYDFAPRRGKK